MRQPPARLHQDGQREALLPLSFEQARANIRYLLAEVVGNVI